MTEHTQLIDAINIRTATRKFDNEPMSEDQARQLIMTLDAVNLLSGLNLQLIQGHEEVFEEANASQHFTNAKDFLAVVGPKNTTEGLERAGFYAERMVLTATLRGLGSCWVAGSWNRARAQECCHIQANEQLYLGVAIGRPNDYMNHLSTVYERLTEIQQTHRTTKSFEEFIAPVHEKNRSKLPQWFVHGVEAAMKAPSAMNRQPITFSYSPDDDTASAHLDSTINDPMQYVDLGIAKLHFQIGANQGTWGWSDGALFIHD